MEDIKVTIGMPVYNGERYLQDALSSLLKQDFKEFELIISDNASTDKTQSICREFLKKDPRVKYFRNEADKGAIYNFNRVLELSKGRYFMWAGYDDIWEPTFVSDLFYKLDANPVHVLAFCKFDIMDGARNKIRDINIDWGAYFDRPRLLRMLSMIFKHYSSQKACLVYGLIRKECFKGFYSNHADDTQGCDIATLLSLLTVGPFIFVNKRLFHYTYRDAPLYQKKRLAESVYFSIKDKFVLKIFKNVSQFKIDLAYKPLNNTYYSGLRHVVTAAPLTFFEKIILNIAITMEKLLEPSKVCNILSLYTRAFLSRLRRV